MADSKVAAVGGGAAPPPPGGGGGGGAAGAGAAAAGMTAEAQKAVIERYQNLRAVVANLGQAVQEADGDRAEHEYVGGRGWAEGRGVGLSGTGAGDEGKQGWREMEGGQACCKGLCGQGEARVGVLGLACAHAGVCAGPWGWALGGGEGGRQPANRLRVRPGAGWGEGAVGAFPATCWLPGALTPLAYCRHSWWRKRHPPPSLSRRRRRGCPFVSRY